MVDERLFNKSNLSSMKVRAEALICICLLKKESF